MRPKFVAKRRRLRDRIHIPPPEVAFDEAKWAAILAETLTKASSRQSQNWRQRRDQVRMTVGALRLALAEHPAIGRTSALDDLMVLEFALAGLNTGEVHSLIRHGGRANTLPDSAAQTQFRRIVLQCCEHLTASGLDRSEAYKLVAKELSLVGVYAPRSQQGETEGFKASTIKRWHQATLPGRTGEVERRDDAAWLERWMPKTPGTDAASAKGNVRTWLRERLVTALFPEVRKGGVPTH